MTQYINKDALVTEIEEKKIKISPNRDWYFDEYTNGYIDALKDILSFLDTFEVKEVNLEKELETLNSLLYDLDGVAVKGTTSYLTVEDIKDIAKRFFELGLKAKDLEQSEKLAEIKK